MTKARLLLALWIVLASSPAWAQDGPPSPGEAGEVDESVLSEADDREALVDSEDSDADSDDADSEEAEEDEPAPVERITFSLPFEDEAGGGVAAGTAGTLNYVGENVVVASDAVEVRYQNLKLQAETVEVDLSTKIVTAEGRVVLDEGPRRVTGERLEFDFDTKTGTFFEAQAYVDPDVYFEGREIEKVEDDLYTVTDGTMTSCSEDQVPDWSFRLGKARVRVDGFARVKNTRMRIKKVPFLYLPYMAFPTQGGRAPGFLFPNFGYSESRGGVLGLAYFQPFGDSYDATIYGDIYGEEYYGLGTEFRYRPNQTTAGTFRAFAIDDPIENKTRWKASWRHSSDQLPFGLRGVVNFRDFSDFDFFRRFERNFNDVSIRSLYSGGFLSGNWGSQSLNVLVDQRETFIRNGVTVTQRQLPEIIYRLRPTRLGKLPLYFSLLSSVNQFEVDRTGVIEGSYARADVLPTFTMPLSTVPWLSVSLAASGRSTWYEDSVTPNRTSFTGESLTRTFPTGTASIIGPSFSKVMEKRLGAFGKFKHIIEPRWSYVRVDEFEDQARVPLFDEVDSFVNREIFSVSLVNRVLAKSTDDDSLVGAREVLSFEVGQSFSLRDEQPFERSRDGTLIGKKSPIAARLRFTPSTRLNFEARSTYSSLFGRMSSASLLGGLRLGPNAVSLTWVTSIDPELGTTRNHQARVFTDLTLVRNHLRMQNQVNLDLVTGMVQQHRHVFFYTSQCYSIRLEFRQLQTTTIRDRDIRLGISLKNIGSFLDLNHGGRERL